MNPTQRDLKKQLTRSPAQNARVPYIPFLKDRVQLSSDALEARANRENAVVVHKRNPHTTYLSQIDLMIDMINEVAEAQEAAETKIAKPVAAAAPGKARKPGLKPPASKPKALGRPKPVAQRARMSPSGTVIIK